MAKSSIQITSSGDFYRLGVFLRGCLSIEKKVITMFRKYGKEGIDILSDATPKRTGKTSESWSYKIERNGKGDISLTFRNSNLTENQIPVVVLIVYGHATRNGGWVQGRDFLTPAVDPLFAEIQNRLREEVVKL